MTALTSFVKRHRLVAFFVLVFVLEAAITLLLAGAADILPFALTAIPAVVALTLAGIEGRAELRVLLRRVVIWRVGLKWYLIVFGLPVLTALIIILLGVLLGAQVAGLGTHLTPSLLIVFAVVLLPAFGEELGWRGYGLPKLLEGHSALAASLILGVLWTAFHLPLFLPGQEYGTLTIWPLPFELIGLSVLFAWVFIHTRGSVLLVTLFHAMVNTTTPMTGDIDPVVAWELRGIVLAAMAIIVVLLAGPDLMRQSTLQTPAARRDQPVA